MIERFLEQQQAFHKQFLQQTWAYGHSMPKDSDVQTLERVFQLLGPLRDFTIYLALKQRPPSHLWSLLWNNQLNEKEGDDALTKQMKKVMMDDLQHRYSCEKVKKVTDITCFTDPCFKDNFNENKEDVIRSAEEEAVNLADTTSLPPQESPAATADQEQGTNTAPSAATRKKDKSLSKTSKSQSQRCLTKRKSENGD